MILDGRRRFDRGHPLDGRQTWMEHDFGWKVFSCKHSLPQLHQGCQENKTTIIALLTLQYEANLVKQSSAKP